MENIANMEQRRGGANIASSATRGSGTGGAVLEGCVPIPRRKKFNWKL